MRIAVPNRFEPKYVALFIFAMFVGQGLEGTLLSFQLLTALYIALWATAFNVAGGISYPSGAFIFSSGLFSIIIGVGAKVLLLEPGHTHFQAPIKTMLAYCVGMAMMLVAAFLSRALRPREPLIKGFDTLEAMHQASIVCLCAGIFLVVANTLAPGGAGSLISALRQINQFPAMSVLLGTTYTVRKTNGRRSMNWVVMTGIGIGVAFGIFYFGKESFLIGFVEWGIAASLQGYQFKKGQIISIALGGAFMVYYLVPYSQYVRVYASRTGSIRENIPVAIEYLSDLNRTRRLYYESIDEYAIEDEAHLYDKREGFLDRLIIVAADDALIHYTDQGHVFGLTPTISEYANVVPHFIWRGKPTVNAGNEYAHELNWLPEDDDTTGIAFSATGDAYHQASWLGLLLLLPVNCFICFIVFDSVSGSARTSVFALLPIIMLFQDGAGGGVSGPIHEATYGLASLLAIVWTSKKLGPFIVRTIRQRQFAPLQVAPAPPRPISATLAASSFGRAPDSDLQL